MATTGYMTDRLALPSEARVAFDQQVFPHLIDAASAVDRGAAILAARTVAHPFTACAAALIAGYVAARLRRRYSRAALKRRVQ